MDGTEPDREGGPLGKLRGAAIGFAAASAVLALAAWFGVPLSRPAGMTGAELVAAGFASILAGAVGGLLGVGRLGAAREPMPEDRWLAGLSGPALAAAVHIALSGAEQTVDIGVVVVVGGLLAGGVLGSRGATTSGGPDPGATPDLHWRHRLPGQRRTGEDAGQPEHTDSAATEPATDEPPPHADQGPSTPQPSEAPEGPNDRLGPPRPKG